MPSFHCISCKEEVCDGQEALRCDGCSQWQHRRLQCKSGMSRQQYRELVKNNQPFTWKCSTCTQAAANGPVLESTLSCRSIRMTPHDLEEMMQDPPTSCRLVD